MGQKFKKWRSLKDSNSILERKYKESIKPLKIDLLFKLNQKYDFYFKEHRRKYFCMKYNSHLIKRQENFFKKGLTYKRRFSSVNNNFKSTLKSNKTMEYFFQDLIKNIENTIKDSCFININNREKLKSQVLGVIEENQNISLDNSNLEINSKNLSRCFICQINLLPNELFSTQLCEHYFCYFCGKTFFEKKVEQKYFLFKCPFYKCNKLAHLKIIKKLITNQHFNSMIKTLANLYSNQDKFANKNNELLINNYINDCNKNHLDPIIAKNGKEIPIDDKYFNSEDDYLENINRKIIEFQNNNEFQNMYLNKNISDKNYKNINDNNKNLINYEINNLNFDFHNNNNGQNIMEFVSFKTFQEMNKNREKYCKECNEPSLFDRFGKNTIKCLNCLKVKCKYCNKEIDQNHFKLTGFNYCKVFYRRTLKLKYENLNPLSSRFKNFIITIILYLFSYFLLISTCFFLFKNFLRNKFGINLSYNDTTNKNYFNKNENKIKKNNKNNNNCEQIDFEIKNINSKKNLNNVQIQINNKIKEINRNKTFKKNINHSDLNKAQNKDKIIETEGLIFNANDNLKINSKIKHNNSKSITDQEKYCNSFSELKKFYQINSLIKIEKKIEKSKEKESIYLKSFYLIKSLIYYILLIIIISFLLALSISIAPFYPLILNIFLFFE